MPGPPLPEREEISVALIEDRDASWASIGRRLAGALRRPKPRRATRPSKGPVERRLEQKRRQSQRNAGRRDLDDR